MVHMFSACVSDVLRMLTFDSSSDIYIYGFRFNLEVDLGLRISDCGVKITCEWTECLKPLEVRFAI